MRFTVEVGLLQGPCAFLGIPVTKIYLQEHHQHALFQYVYISITVQQLSLTFSRTLVPEHDFASEFTIE